MDLSTVNTVDNDIMPIAGFFGPYRSVDTKGVSYDFVNDDTYQKIKKLGINLICHTSGDYANASQQQTILDNLALSEKYGIGYYVTDSWIKEDCTDLQLATRISEYAGFQSFKGIFVIDEPFTQNYASLDALGNSTYEKKKLEDYMGSLSLLNSYSNLTGYVNLNPRNQALNRTSEDLDVVYKNYVQACLDTGIKEISWDYYVWDQYISSATTTSNYFKNLSVIREKAIENKVPFWSYVQAGSNWNDSYEDKEPTDNIHPTEAELLWNVNTSLAYGAKGIQYFTLIQPSYFAYTEGGTYDYERNGLIGANGEPTKWYGYAQKANKQVSLIDEYLMRAETKAILATVNGNAKRDTGLSADEYEGISISATNGAIAGIFDCCGKTAIYIVNYQTADTNADEITVNFDSSRKYKVVGTNEQLINGNGEAEGNSCTVELVDGGAALILLQ